MFDTVTSARALMGLSLAFHIVFAMFGIGLPLMLLIAEGIALRAGNALYREMARAWARPLAVLFAVGAVSGTILSFEFGLLWPTWMEFSGAIIGLPFALEGFAFFTEAIFLGLYLFGWERLSPRAHWLCTIPLVVSSALSAFFVISANAWMNQPEGFEVVAGKAVNVDPLAAMLNDAMPYQVVHGTLPAYVVTGFAVAAVYAFAMLRGDRSAYNRKALALAMAVAAVATPLQIVSGDLSARFLAHQQPEKFAAMEAQFETERGAPLRIGGIPDPDDRTVRYAIEVPKLASFLAFEDVNAEIPGLNSFPESDVPDVRIVHYSFQAMVGIGFLLLFVSLWFWVATWRRKRVDPGRALLGAILAAGPLGVVALQAGWFVTEFGRQPWIIYRLMRVEDAATPREGIGFVFLVFTLVYVALAIGLGLILLRERGRGARSAALQEAPHVA